jgi:putative membrane protein
MEKNSRSSEYQPQIIFDDNSTFHAEQPVIEPTVTLDNHQWQPIDADPVNTHKQPIASSNYSSSKKNRWILKSLFAVIVVILGIELFEFFTTGFNESPITTSLYAVVFAIISGSALMTGLKEFRQLKRLKGRQQLQQQIALVDSADATEVLKAQFSTMITQLPTDLTEQQYQQWQYALSQPYNADELQQAFDRIILQPIDQQAINTIAHYSAEAVVLVSLSPMAALDMMIVLWRNINMIDKIAGLYGIELGYASRLSLLKQVMLNMAYAGVSEVIADWGSSLLSANVVSKLSSKLAQGAGAGVLTARLGIKTVELTRPLLHTQALNYNLPSIKKAMINNLTSSILKRK